MMSVWATTALLVCGLAIAPLMLSASQALHQQRDSGARGQADACRWLVLAWSSDVVDEPPSSGWPVTCPPGKRCLALVLSP